MPTPLDKLRASEDKRVKLTDEDRKEIVRLSIGGFVAGAMISGIWTISALTRWEP